jgi:septal ring factor EnvC (AmiA/AmiB activator)
MKLTKLGLIAVLSCMPLMADNMVNSIMKLRADVEKLYSEIDSNREAFKSHMKSLAVQRADNDVSINRLEMELQSLNQEIASTELLLKDTSGTKESIQAMLLKALADLETKITTSVPFKVNERVADIQKLRTQLNEGTISEQKALALIWSSYDELLRTTQDIGIYKQQITLNSEVKLAKVAKVGSVMLYFMTPDEKVGYMEKKKEGTFEPVVVDGDEAKQITVLFDSLQKQIRTGYFTLPNALIVSEAK